MLLNDGILLRVLVLVEVEPPARGRGEVVDKAAREAVEERGILLEEVAVRAPPEESVEERRNVLDRRDAEFLMALRLSTK